MFFNKYPHPSNFVFGSQFVGSRLKVGKSEVGVEADSFEGGIHRLRLSSAERWSPLRKIVDLIEPVLCGESGVSISSEGGFAIADETGKVVLRTTEGRGFGVQGETWLFSFEVHPETRYYGMGEKVFGRLELAGIRTKFWNTDVWGDFHYAQWKKHPADPAYLSIPYVILQTDSGFVGILVSNGHTAFFETPGTEGARVFVEWQKTFPSLLVGSEGGQPELWIVTDPTIKGLTRKFQKLVGTTPLPPLWALGYHQSRWGYAGEDDLVNLHTQFKRHEIPCDGLWLDIDYMRGYRLFTVDKQHFPNGTKQPFAELLAENRRVVAIIDPGVKQEKGYEVYDDGVKKEVFCQTCEGGEFVGLVWPGETVFPDFTLPETRTWWANRVADFTLQGFGGYWVDMNDPSTGPVNPEGMLFNRGTEPHAAHRNEYSVGMQMATFEGMKQAIPHERPFILSRSGHIGTSRYSAVWTGDNVSNYFYLKACIPTSLNLSLSGIPFNGPDIGGFGDDTSEPLMVDWIKTCFLFPFTRNHTGFGTRKQEPWAFSDEAKATISHFIRLRYKLLPYLYNLYMDQEEHGDPILRPTFYEFPKAKAADDVFFVGPSILQAPFIEEKKRTRKVSLPGNEPWFAAASGEWVDSGSHRLNKELAGTPLYIRNGAIIPMQPGLPTTNETDLRQVEIHIFAAPGTTGTSSYRYRADDGLSYDYKAGVRSELDLAVNWDGDQILITTDLNAESWGKIAFSVVLHVGDRSVELDSDRPALKPVPCDLAGRKFYARSIPHIASEKGRCEDLANARL